MNITQDLPASALAELAHDIASRRRVPGATYRLQFGPSFTFRDAAALVPYLARLGVTDCYASPLLKARPNSTHGYDICDHSQLNPALGSEQDFEALVEALHRHGMGLLLDIVPNHMGIGDVGNIWWQDVLENGPSSVYADYFDIDWRPLKAELRDKVLLPVLEDQYGKVLESGKLRLVYEDRAFWVCYYATKLPIAPQSYARLLGFRLEALTEALGSDHEHIQELQSILTAISYLPPRTEQDPDKVAERYREKEVIKRRIAALYDASAEFRAALDETLAVYNGVPGAPRSFDLLDSLLDDQAYRLAFWRVAGEEINYRRFFDINDLAAIRVERPDVFAATHALVLHLLTEGKVTGLRIDHPDGLRDPTGYLAQVQISYLISQLQARLGPESALEDMPAAVLAWYGEQSRRAPEAARRSDGANGTAPAPGPLYVVAEKILSRGETLPDDWLVDGTTGYEFAAAVNGLLVDSANRKAFDAIYHRFIRSKPDLKDLINAAKKMTMLVSLASEVNLLSHQLNSISEKHRWYRDFTLNSLTFALREVIACLPVYRTYIRPGQPVSRRDQAVIEAAVAEAKKRNPRTAESIFDFLRDTLLLRNLGDFAAEDQAQLMDFVLKFQQVTGPVMAKSVEDTVLYRYNRLLSLNEVGADPDQFGISPAQFHRQNAERRRRWPHALLTTSTHDTKRSEDVRARLNVLTCLPAEWRAAVARWSRMNRRKKTVVDGRPAPDANDEYLLYQTLVGVWPFEELDRDGLDSLRARIAAYMQKATREAKVHTSWVNPNTAYDQAVQDFVARVLADTPENAFLSDLRSFQRRIAYFGVFNSLAQTLLKLTSPGVPDLYQGTELWDLSLVDPDNRRPVDFGLRRRQLAQLERALARPGGPARLARELLAHAEDGRIKLYVTARTLAHRRDQPALYAEGSYLPLDVVGARREYVVAFARTLPETAVVVVVPRLAARLTGGVEQPPLGEDVWRDTCLALPHEAAGTRYRNLFTDEVVAVAEHEGVPALLLADLLQCFPVALLERIGA